MRGHCLTINIDDASVLDDMRDNHEECIRFSHIDDTRNVVHVLIQSFMEVTRI